MLCKQHFIVLNRAQVLGKNIKNYYSMKWNISWNNSNEERSINTI